MTARAARILLVFLLAGPAPTPRLASAETGLTPREARIYRQICATCHARPGLGIPLTGDEEAWAPRREPGLAKLVENTVNGIGDMPPLGTCSFCTRADLEALVAYLAGLPSE